MQVPEWATPKTRVKMASPWGVWHDVQTRNVSRLRQAEGNSRLDFVLFGDGLTAFSYGYSASRNAPGSSGPWQKHFSGLNAVPLGIDRDQIGQLVWRCMIGGEKPSQDPKVVAVLVGMHDLMKKTEKDPPTEERMDFFLEWLHATMPTTKVILCGLQPCNGNDLRSKRAELNEAYKALARKHLLAGMNIYYYEPAERLTASNGGPSIPGVLVDGLYLTMRGQDAMLASLRAMYEKVLSLPFAYKPSLMTTMTPSLVAENGTQEVLTVE